jgi:serine protease Do
VRDVVASARTEGKRTVLLRVKKGDNTRFVALPLIRS